jgi:hypothetical protein
MDIRNSTLSGNFGSNWHEGSWGGGINNEGTLNMTIPSLPTALVVEIASILAARLA